MAAGTKPAPSPAGQTQDDIDVGAGQEVREEALLVFERGDDGGMDTVGLEVDDGCADQLSDLARDPVDVGGDDARRASAAPPAAGP